MDIFKNRYQAEKTRKEDPCYSASDKIVKVDGGYVIMTEVEYYVWKNQK